MTMEKAQKDHWKGSRVGFGNPASREYRGRRCRAANLHGICAHGWGVARRRRHRHQQGLYREGLRYSRRRILAAAASRGTSSSASRIEPQPGDDLRGWHPHPNQTARSWALSASPAAAANEDQTVAEAADSASSPRRGLSKPLIPNGKPEVSGVQSGDSQYRGLFVDARFRI